jgi:ataxia telangiectasia mutated family protein
MGPCGTEGTFVHAAEETTRLLRKNARALLTILSAVVSDPLYKWSVSPVEARRRQTGKDEDVGLQDDVEVKNQMEDHELDGKNDLSSIEDQNKAGAKALAKISEKLQGYEDSTSGEQQGVEGQVQLLINSARDPDNLCEMFAGWAPWL